MEKGRAVPEFKKSLVEDLKKLIEKSRTVLIASIKGIPASQFQAISKKLRGKAVVKVPKKSLIMRALENSGKKELKQLEDQIGNSVAILFSELDSFELAAELLENTSPSKAKPGQEAPEDILVEAGPTELLPGPAISELGSVGLEIQIEKGKISIKKSKVIVEKGKKISANAADVMSKLDIKPFRVGFIPKCAYDSQDGKLYLEISIDKQGTLDEMKTLFGRALAFAVSIGQYNKQTMPFIISKAARNGLAMEQLLGKSSEENIVEKVDEESKEDTQIKETSEEA